MLKNLLETTRLTALLLLAAAATAGFALAQTDRVRVLPGQPISGPAVESVVQSEYGDLVDNMSSGRSDLERQIVVRRLALALRLYSRGLQSLGADTTIGPSPLALRKIESMLPRVGPGQSYSDIQQYTARFQPLLDRMGTPALKQLMHEIASEVNNNKDKFADNNPGLMKKVEKILDNPAGAPKSGISAVSTVSVADDTDSRPTNIDTDTSGETLPLAEDELPVSTPGSLSRSDLQGLPDRTLKDMLKHNPPGADIIKAELDNRAVASNREDASGSTGTSGMGTGGTLCENATDCLNNLNAANSESLSGEAYTARLEHELGVDNTNRDVPGWFNATLANLTDFFQSDMADSDSDDNQKEQTYWDPFADNAKGKLINRDELEKLDFADQFDSELITHVNNADEAVASKLHPEAR